MRVRGWLRAHRLPLRSFSGKTPYRALGYLAVSIPLCFTVPTAFGAVCQLCVVRTVRLARMHIVCACLAMHSCFARAMGRAGWGAARRGVRA